MPRITSMAAKVAEVKEPIIVLKRFSSLEKLLKVTMLVFRFVYNLKQRKNNLTV